MFYIGPCPYLKILSSAGKTYYGQTLQLIVNIRKLQLQKHWARYKTLTKFSALELVLSLMSTYCAF
jgi:hypothetical protein